MRGKRRVLHPGGPELTRVTASAASCSDRDEHGEMVPIVLLSQKDELSSATGTTSEGEGKAWWKAPWEGKKVMQCVDCELSAGSGRVP